MKGKKVLITGGLGFIGSNLAHRCLAEGASVTIFDSLESQSGANLYNIHQISAEVEVVTNDIRDFDPLSSAVEDKDYIFHCAAFTSHPNSMKNPLTDIDVNCKGTINLLEAVRRLRSEAKLVYVGTSTQIGRMKFSPVTELHPQFPVDIYSANKSAAEAYVLIYQNAYGINATVVRLVNTFGPRSNIKSPDFGFMNYFIGLALQGKEITIFGEGRQMRSLTYIDDAISALVDAAVSKNSTGEVFFAAAKEQYSVAQIGAAIEANVGGSLKHMPWPSDRKAIEIGDAVIASEKIRETLGWQPSFSLEDGLKRTRAYFEGCLDKYI